MRRGCRGARPERGREPLFDLSDPGFQRFAPPLGDIRRQFGTAGDAALQSAEYGAIYLLTERTVIRIAPFERAPDRSFDRIQAGRSSCAAQPVQRAWPPPA